MLGGLVLNRQKQPRRCAETAPEKSADSIVRGLSSLTYIRVVIDTHRSVKMLTKAFFRPKYMALQVHAYSLTVNSDNYLTPIHTGRTIHETVGDHLQPSTNEFT